MRTAQDRFDMHRAKHPDQPDELAWNFAIKLGLHHDPADEDDLPDSLVRPEGSPPPNRTEERTSMAHFFRLSPSESVAIQLLDALEVAWGYPGPEWFRALKRLVFREGYVMPGRGGPSTPREDELAARFTRTWAARDLIRLWNDVPSSSRGRAAILAVAALTIGLPVLRAEFRDGLHDAARSWSEGAAFLRDVADRDVAEDPVGQLRALLQSGSASTGNVSESQESRPGGGAATKLRPCDERAHKLYLWAVEQNPGLAAGTDRDVFEWLSRRPDAAEGLPDRCDSWAKYLRCARAYYGDHKHTPRGARPGGRNVVRPDDL